MQKRALGKSDLSIVPLVLGGNVFGWTIDQTRSFEVLDAFIDGGGEAIDTAPIYSYWPKGHQGGESETVLGAWFAQGGKRARVKLLTKVGAPPNDVKIDAKSIAAACEGSLKRLQTDHIDLYQIHFDDNATDPEEFMGALDALVKAGKVGVLGSSNMSAARLTDANAAAAKHGFARFDTMQPQYNLMRREIEADLLPACVAEGISVLTYFSLAAGYLTGKYRTEADLSKSTRNEQAAKFLKSERGPKVIAALDEVAARTGASVAQCALGWLLAKPGVAAPLASASSVAQVRELLGALEVELSAEDVAALDRASA